MRPMRQRLTLIKILTDTISSLRLHLGIVTTALRASPDESDIVTWRSAPESVVVGGKRMKRKAKCPVGTTASSKPKPTIVVM